MKIYTKCEKENKFTIKFIVKWENKKMSPHKNTLSNIFNILNIYFSGSLSVQILLEWKIWEKNSKTKIE